MTELKGYQPATGKLICQPRRPNSRIDKVRHEDYLKDYPESRLIVIDTLQKVRTASKDNAYASDYGDISLIKDFADRHSLAVIVVHHIRKQNDSDVFNKVSGTTGLTGSADATFVLEKEKRASDTAEVPAGEADAAEAPAPAEKKPMSVRARHALRRGVDVYKRQISNSALASAP